MVNSWVQVILLSVSCVTGLTCFLPISPYCGSHLCFPSDLWYCTSCLMFIGPYIFLKIYLFLCVWMFGSMYISVFHMHAWCLLGSEEDIRSLGSTAIDSCEWPFGCWELNQEPLEGQSGLFNHWAISPALVVNIFKRTIDSSPLSTFELGCFWIIEGLACPWHDVHFIIIFLPVSCKSLFLFGVCVHMYVGVCTSNSRMRIQRLEKCVRDPALSLCVLFLSDRIAYWTWELAVWLGWPVSSQDLPVSAP